MNVDPSRVVPQESVQFERASEAPSEISSLACEPVIGQLRKELERSQEPEVLRGNVGTLLESYRGSLPPGVNADFKDRLLEKHVRTERKTTMLKLAIVIGAILTGALWGTLGPVALVFVLIPCAVYAFVLLRERADLKPITKDLKNLGLEDPEIKALLSLKKSYLEAEGKVFTKLFEMRQLIEEKQEAIAEKFNITEQAFTPAGLSRWDLYTVGKLRAKAKSLDEEYQRQFRNAADSDSLNGLLDSLEAAATAYLKALDSPQIVRDALSTAASVQTAAVTV